MVYLPRGTTRVSLAASARRRPMDSTGASVVTAINDMCKKYSLQIISMVESLYGGTVAVSLGRQRYSAVGLAGRHIKKA